MRLTEMEYLLLHGGNRGHLLRYELLWDGGNGDENHLCGLLNVTGNGENSEGDKRKSGHINGKSDAETGKSAPGLVQVWAKSAPQNMASEQAEHGLSAAQVCPEQNAVIREKNKTVLPLSPSLPGA